MTECSPEYEEYLKTNPIPKPGDCFGGAESSTYEWGPTRNLCRTVSLTWAVGGDIVQDLPPELGYPFGGSDLETKYFYLEIHYDNPSLKQSSLFFKLTFKNQKN